MKWYIRFAFVDLLKSADKVKLERNEEVTKDD